MNWRIEVEGDVLAGRQSRPPETVFADLSKTESVLSKNKRKK